MTSTHPTAIELCAGIALPSGYRFAPFGVEHLSQVLELLNVCGRLVYGKDTWTSQEMETAWTNPSASPENDAILVLDSEGQIIGFEEVFHHTGHVVLQCMGNQVHPTHRGIGIEDALLDWAIRRAEAASLGAAPNERVILRAPVGLPDVATRTLLENAGFAPIRYYLTMCKDLTEPIDEPSWPEGVSIRSLAEASTRSNDPDNIAGLDKNTVAAFYRTRWLAFQDHWGVSVPFEDVFEKFRHEISVDSRFDPHLFWGVFEDKHSPAGQAPSLTAIGRAASASSVGTEASISRDVDAADSTLSDFPPSDANVSSEDYRHDTPVAICFSYPHHEEEGAGFVSDVGTLPDWRRQSLARSLLLLCFRELARRGLSRVYLHVDETSPTGAVGLYSGAGMVVTERIAIMAKEIRPGQDSQ